MKAPTLQGTLHIDHELKTWTDVFDEIVKGIKVHEFRKNDRDFQVGNILLLREFVPAGERYTGRNVLVKITSISFGPEWGIPFGFAAFSIRVLKHDVMTLEEK